MYIIILIVLMAIVYKLVLSEKEGINIFYTNKYFYAKKFLKNFSGFPPFFIPLSGQLLFLGLLSGQLLLDGRQDERVARHDGFQPVDLGAEIADKLDVGVLVHRGLVDYILGSIGIPIVG